MRHQVARASFVPLRLVSFTYAQTPLLIFAQLRRASLCTLPCLANPGLGQGKGDTKET